MMLATSTLWSVPGGNSVMPANDKSPLHGLLIAPQASRPAGIQPASIRSRWGPPSWVGVPIAIAPTSSAIYDYSQQPEPFLVSGLV